MKIPAILVLARNVLLSAVFIAVLVSCNGKADEDSEYRHLRTRLDDAVRLQFEKDSCEAAMKIYSEVAASYSTDKSEDIKQLVVESLNRMWYVYYFVLFDYVDAAECIKKGIDICETDSIESSRLYLNIGLSYSLLAIRQNNPSEKMFKLADKNLKEAHRRAVASKNVNVADYSLLNMIVLYDKVSYPITELEPFLQQSISLHNGNQDIEVAFAIELFDIVRWFQEGKYATIILKVDQFLKSTEFEDDEIRNKYQLLLYKSRALTANGQPNDALALLESIKNDADSLGLSDVLISVYEQNYNAYSKAGKQNEAYQQQFAYYEACEEQYLEESLMTINELPLISRIRESNIHLAHEKHRRKITGIFAISITVIVCLLILIAVILVRKNNRLRAANEVLFRRNEEQLKCFEKKSVVVNCENNTPEERIPASIAKSQNEAKQPLDTIDDDLQKIYISVIETIEHNQLWRNPSLLISRLAVDMGISEKLLSKAIHAYGGMNFSSFINKYRIMEASKMLGNEKEYGHLTLQGIAETVGFKSRTSFISAFKQHVGMLPSEYRKLAMDKHMVVDK